MKHRSPALLAAVLLSGALTLSACNNGASSPGSTDAENAPAGDTSSAAAPTADSTDGGQPGSSPAASAEPLSEDEQDGSDDPAWDTGSDGDNALTITKVRVGSHDDYSRIVLEFEGEGTPGWNAPQWDVDASTMGKGDPITVKGDHTLVIHGTGTASAPSSGQQQVGQQRLDLDKSDDDEGIEEAFVDPGFEGEFQVVLGTDSQTYRIFTLSDPTRLVIDVADDDQEHSDDQDRDDLGGSGQDQEEHGDEG